MVLGPTETLIDGLFFTLSITSDTTPLSTAILMVLLSGIVSRLYLPQFLLSLSFCRGVNVPSFSFTIRPLAH